jgi:catechol 2,3-dioxygenase
VGTQAAHTDPSLRPIDPALQIGSVRLAVADLGASVDFYGRVLGLATSARDADRVQVGGDGRRALLELERIPEPVPASPHSTGLYHVAWLHPSREALAASVERVIAARWPIHGASDHGVSEALYLSDPDGLGVEIYADRPREQWSHGPGGELEMVTLPLDLDDLLAQSPLDPVPGMPAAIAVGHIHLKVSDVPRAAAFYREALGFEEQAHMPSAAFLAAGGYHHHIGLNSWQSRGAGSPPANTPGLRLVTFELGGSETLGAFEERLERAPGAPLQVERRPGRVTVSDPDGHRLAFAAGGGGG